MPETVTEPQSSPASAVSVAGGRAYADWKAPQADSQILLWPEPRALLAETIENGRLLRSADAVRFQGVPLPEIRQKLRAFLGHADASTPLIVTGHQAELHHAGVWAKNALIDAVATKLGGQSMHVAVDTDATKHLSLRWPGRDGSAVSLPLTDDPSIAEADWSGLLAPPTPAHLHEVTEAYDSARRGWSFEPVLGGVLDSLRVLSLESQPLANTLINALHKLDWSLGLRHHALLASPIFASLPYLVFAHHLLARADAFAADYNAALADYRVANGIRTPGRPMPDLRMLNDECEAPFWLDDLATGKRSRAAAVRSGGRWAIHSPAGDDAFRFDPSAEGWAAADALLMWLRRHSLRISPRAMTLTAVLRLLVADQFVHGIGGGRYDQVLDSVLSRHFNLTPPAFAVTTATLYFPEAVNRPRACLPCLRHEGHQLAHRLLGDKKSKQVEAIAAAPRRSTERARMFSAMREELDQAARHNATLLDWDRRLREAIESQQAERTLFDRELFYALQPRERLESVINEYRRRVHTETQ